jgi:hypothetical protein
MELLLRGFQERKVLVSPMYSLETYHSKVNFPSLGQKVLINYQLLPMGKQKMEHLPSFPDTSDSK